jgi:hypothetical protein
MRGLGRRLAYGFLLTPLVGVGAFAQLPPPSPLPLPAKGTRDPGVAPKVRDQMSADFAALMGNRKDVPRDVADDGGYSERARLQNQLQELLNRLNSPRPAPVGPSIPAAPKVSPLPATTEKSVDSIREGMNRFRDNDIEVALAVFRLVDQGTLSREDRAFIQYMTATCLRRLSRISEAAKIYREVADVREDEFLAEMAIWQLSMIRTAQDLESQLEQLRARARSR